MHELGVVFHVIRMVEDVAEENDLTEIASVTLEIGEVSGIIESYLQSCWKWSVEKNPRSCTAQSFTWRQSLPLPTARIAGRRTRPCNMVRHARAAEASTLIYCGETNLISKK